MKITKRSFLSPLFLLFALSLILVNCDSGGSQYNSNSRGNYTYVEEGLDKVIKQHRDKRDFTILLYDMNYEGGKYVHQYQTLYPSTASDSLFEEEISPWYEVSPTFFQQNENNLGMELASRKDGIMSKEVAPAGYSQYVGNEQYGRWQQRDGGSFWEFYGKYALLSSVFNMFTMPARYSYWNDYDRYYRGRQPYYGGGYYGTTSYTSNTKRGKSSTWGKQPSSFKQQVRSRVSQSTSAIKNSNRNRTSNSNRTTRSSNRYNSGGSSSRSRGGGGGK